MTAAWISSNSVSPVVAGVRRTSTSLVPGQASAISAAYRRVLLAGRTRGTR